MKPPFSIALLILAASAAQGAAPQSATLDEATFRRHLATLASDEFEGRKPATRGEEKTIEYIRSQFAAAGLAPGSLQDVALFYQVGDRISHETGWPNWFPGNEFRAARDRSRNAQR